MDFAVARRFHSEGNFGIDFVAAKRAYSVVKWHSCQRVVSQLRNTLRNGVSAMKRWISRLGKFAAISQLRNGCTWLQNGTRVPRGLFAAVKIFAEGARRLRNGFVAEIDFHSEEGDFCSGA